jgi:hypothetical protein
MDPDYEKLLPKLRIVSFCQDIGQLNRQQIMGVVGSVGYELPKISQKYSKAFKE